MTGWFRTVIPYPEAKCRTAPKAAPHNESCGALRKFYALTVLRFHGNTSSIAAKPRLVSTQNLRANRSCSIVRRCLVSITYQRGFCKHFGGNSCRTAEKSAGAVSTALQRGIERSTAVRQRIVDICRKIIGREAARVLETMV